MNQEDERKITDLVEEAVRGLQGQVDELKKRIDDLENGKQKTSYAEIANLQTQVQSHLQSKHQTEIKQPKAQDSALAKALKTETPKE